MAVAAEHVALVVELLQHGVLRRLLRQQRDDLLAQLVVEGLALGEEHVALVLVAHHRELPEQLPQLVADRHRLVRQRLVNMDHELLAALLEGAAHAEAELGVVLEERVGPRGALPARVLGVGEGGVRRAPDGGAPRRVGHHEAVAEQLREQLYVGRLPAALAGAAELEVGQLELRALDRRLVDLLAVVGERHGELPVALLELDRLVHALHLERVRRADAHAQLAARAVERRHLNAEVVVVEGAAADGLAGALLEARRGLLEVLGRRQERPHRRVRADERAVVALGALVHVDARYVERDAPLLVP
mmetsp:Transcript_59901/g.125221  ORF Transcript_59901/g.125221 Transcript_59901/m.125221 type:complete len:304 (-) Transcript_59901:211-1122(-)